MGDSPISLHDGRHGVRGVLAAAGTGAGASHVFEVVQFLVSDFSGSVGAHRFKHILNRDVLAAIAARRDGAAVKYEPGKIHAGQCHGRGRDRLIATHHANDRVEQLSAADQFNRIGDHLATYQRSPHAFGAHGFAVGDGDGVELHGSAAGGANAFFHFGRKPPQVKVAGHGFNPGVGHADQRLAEVGISEANRFEHGTRRSPVASVGYSAATMFKIHDV